MKLISTIVLASFLMIGCGQNPSKMDRSAAQNLVDNMTYVVDPHTGNCYAVVASRKDFELEQNGFTVTWVPSCPKH